MQGVSCKGMLPIHLGRSPIPSHHESHKGEIALPAAQSSFHRLRGLILHVASAQKRASKRLALAAMTSGATSSVFTIVMRCGSANTLAAGWHMTGRQRARTIYSMPMVSLTWIWTNASSNSALRWFSPVVLRNVPIFLKPRARMRL